MIPTQAVKLCLAALALGAVLTDAAVADDGARPGTVAITNVRVFDGKNLTALRTVVIENGLISSAATAETMVDGQGGTLLPGLIDSHTHLDSRQNLEQAARWGVTTMLDMGTGSMALVNSLRHLPGLPDIRSSGNATAPAGGIHAGAMGNVALTSPEVAEAFVAARAAEGAEHIKVIIDSPAPASPAGMVMLDEANLGALVRAAHGRHLRVIGHFTLAESAAMAARAGVDVITHVPQGRPIEPELASGIARSGLIAVPTLVMMKGIIARLPEDVKARGVDYRNAETSVRNLRQAGVPIVAGTDANNAPGAPFQVPHGEALHEELELLVKAGLTPVEALRSATSLPAELFSFTDRGVIEPGRWADLLLVDGDPTTDITATRNIRGVWIAGVRTR